MTCAPGRCRPTILLLAVLALLAGAPAASAQITLPQADGTLLELREPARRIITLAPNLAELAFAAGAGEYLVATAEYSNHPAAARTLPRIGDAFRIDLERVLTLAPDLVIGWASGNPPGALQRLEELGLAVWRTEVRAPGEIATLMRHIARATGDESRAAPSIAEVQRKLAAIGAAYPDRSPLRYFYQVAPQPLFTLNGEHLVSRGFALCGGVNVFAAAPVLASQVTREAVLAADPEVMIAPRLDPDEDPLAQWRSWPRLSATRHGAFVYLPADEISRATPRTLDSIALGCKLMDRFRAAGRQQWEGP